VLFIICGCSPLLAAIFSALFAFAIAFLVLSFSSWSEGGELSIGAFHEKIKASVTFLLKTMNTYCHIRHGFSDLRLRLGEVPLCRARFFMKIVVTIFRLGQVFCPSIGKGSVAGRSCVCVAWKFAYPQPRYHIRHLHGVCSKCIFLLAPEIVPTQIIVVQSAIVSIAMLGHCLPNQNTAVSRPERLGILWSHGVTKLWSHEWSHEGFATRWQQDTQN
jgi:hypothetical protein